MPETYFNKTFCLEVWGDYACFTRPEMKVERVSYDVITPSAARGIFEAIFWKPAIKWIIKRIEVLAPIQWISVRRNEIGSTMSDRSDGLYIEDLRQQRAGLFLRDVHYRLFSELFFIPPNKRKANELSESSKLENKWEADVMRKDENPGKYNAIFERRAGKGQCFHRPYLGCREFSCHFRLIEDHANFEPKTIPETRELGFMLYDLDFSNPNDPQPAFFKAKLEQGVLKVPAWDSEEVRR